MNNSKINVFKQYVDRFKCYQNHMYEYIVSVRLYETK